LARNHTSAALSGQAQFAWTAVVCEHGDGGREFALVDQTPELAALALERIAVLREQKNLDPDIDETYYPGFPACRRLSIAKTPSARNPLIIQVVTSTLQPMIETLRWLAIFMIATLREHRDLALENLALRQQLGVLKRRDGVSRLRKGDRLFWVVLSRIWACPSPKPDRVPKLPRSRVTRRFLIMLALRG